MMLFTYLDDIKKHASLIAFSAFAAWLGFLALLQMAFGWGGAGASAPIPPSPDAPIVAPDLVPPGPQIVPQMPDDGAEGQCLNIEGLIVCEGV